MEKKETSTIRRLRLRNRQVYCGVGVGPAIADRIFDLRLAGWTAAEIGAALNAAIVKAGDV